MSSEERHPDPAGDGSSGALVELVLYSAPECSLCDKALQELRPLRDELGFGVRVVDISGDEELELRYRRRLPVGEVGGRTAFKYRVDADRVRRLVREAAAGAQAGGSTAEQERPRFLVDEMLGRLVRWLRVLGYDAQWRPSISDAELLGQAAAEGRILLTRDTGIMRRRSVRLGRVGALFVRSDHVREQLAQVVRELGLRQGRPRCMVCNGLLEDVSVDEARPRVPAYVAQTQQSFLRCRDCGRIVWRGTHWERIREAVNRAGGLSDRMGDGPGGYNHT
ncbi:MAG: glutaredoxin family protein [Thermoleophilia bacterium]|nr:glutaredoxin family protein [Thermoleophilia bacterium]